MSQPPAACVAILLSTFDGERYLNEQLRSFLAQSHPNWVLYWRDDGSSDSTPRMMDAFAAGPGTGRCIRVATPGRLGATESFLALLRVALTGPADYFAFSDQDDVWLPTKLANGVAALSGPEKPGPGLFYCPRALVDASLRPSGTVPPPRKPPGFPAALTQNVIPGCCMILNRPAARQIEAMGVPERTWHDWWSYLVVAASDGNIVRGRTADILYRQHAGNLVGETAGFWHRTTRAIRRGRGPFMTLFRAHVTTLRARQDLLPETSRAVLAVVAQGCEGGFIPRLKALCLPGFTRQTWAETLIFRLWFLLG